MYPRYAVGAPGEYLDRPGFWHGAIGVSACWLGGARAVAAPLYARAARESVDPHTLAHLGAVDAAITAAEATLLSAACQVDADPAEPRGTRGVDRAADPGGGGDGRATKRSPAPDGRSAQGRWLRMPSMRAGSPI